MTAEEILAKRKLATEVVLIPEWGPEASLIVSQMTGADSDEFNDSLWVVQGKRIIRDHKNVTARMLVRCIVDENGKKVFRPEQVKELGELPSPILNRLDEAAKRLNSTGNLEKKLELALGGESSSDSAS